MTDSRPQNCRNKLRDENKLHPRSGCNVEGCGGAFGNPPRCDLGPLSNDEKSMGYLKIIKYELDDVMKELNLISKENPYFNSQAIHILHKSLLDAYHQIVVITENTQ